MKHRKIIIVLAVSLAARLAYHWIFPERPITLDDALSWDRVAMNVAEGNGFLDFQGNPDPVRPPVYPIFLAAIYKIFGHSFGAAKVFQIFLGALTCGLVFVIGKRALGERPAFWAALGCAVYPPLIVYSTIIGSETLYTFLLALIILAFARALEDPSPSRYLQAGLILGLANLCRSTLSLYPFFLAAAYFLFKRSRRELGLVLFSCAVSFAVILPWTIRNYRAFDNFLLVNVSAGQLFWLGTIEETGGKYVERADYEGYRQFDHLKNPVEVERAHFKAGLRNIAQNPFGFVRLTVLKFFRLWFEPIGHTLTSRRSAFLGWVLLVAHTCLILLAVLGLIRSAPHALFLLPLYALFIYFAIMHNVIAPMPRFRLAIEPFIVLFAVFGLMSVASKKITQTNTQT